MCKPFVAKPISIKDSEGKLKPIQDRAEIIARYYRDHQWSTADLPPPLPPRQPLFPPADDLPTGVFVASELREVRPMLKTNKATGTGEIPNEIIRILLDDALGLVLVLQFLLDNGHGPCALVGGACGRHFQK